MALPPSCSIAWTTDEAASPSFEYVIATFAPSAASRFAIAAPIPREPPVTSATFLVNLVMSSPGKLMCPHYPQIWHSEEYQSFPRGMHGHEMNLSSLPWHP